ncbi:MAG TPA: protease inhibitor I42 family protein [Longimicrobiaceae bacterium]|nr:protease inhibitor I42 family protein [Longimicrobiaceae bacterium]
MNQPITALLLGLALLSGCGDGGIPGNVSEETDPSRPIRVAPGQEFRLVLNSNESTGFRWMLADSAGLRTVQLLERRYERRRGNNNGGAGGRERWSFRATRAGEDSIVLVYRRPWEPRPPVETRRFHVVVR